MAPAFDPSTWKTVPSKSMYQSTLHMANKNDKCTNKENIHEVNKAKFLQFAYGEDFAIWICLLLRRENEWWQEEAEGFPAP